jgi:hypothetical protein
LLSQRCFCVQTDSLVNLIYACCFVVDNLSGINSIQTFSSPELTLALSRTSRRRPRPQLKCAIATAPGSFFATRPWDKDKVFEEHIGKQESILIIFFLHFYFFLSLSFAVL